MGAGEQFEATDRQPCGLDQVDFDWKNGAGTRTRTEDLLITNQLLYQLSYAGPAWTTFKS